MRLWVRLTFGQTSGLLTFGQMYPQDEASGQVDIWSDFRSDWHSVRCTPWMRLWVRLTFGQTLGWPAYPPTDKTGRIGWHLVRWLVCWPFAGWMAGHLTKCPLVYWCKRWTHQRFDLGPGWHFVRWLVGWPIAAGWLGWLTGHLTKCQPDPSQMNTPL